MAVRSRCRRLSTERVRKCLASPENRSLVLGRENIVIREEDQVREIVCYRIWASVSRTFRRAVVGVVVVVRLGVRSQVHGERLEHLEIAFLHADDIVFA